MTSEQPRSRTLRTVIIWVVLIALFVAAYRSPSLLIGVADGIVALYVGGMIGARLGITIDGRLGGFVKMGALAMAIAAGAGAASYAVAGRAALAGALIVTLGVIGAIVLRLVWNRHQLLALKSELEAGANIDRRIERVGTWGTSTIQPVLDLLLAHQRPDMVERILATGRHVRLPLGGGWYRISALLALGRIEAARQLVTSLAGTTTPDVILMLDARVALAEGADPTTVIAAIAAAELQPVLAPWRLELLADAHAAHGNREEARKLLHDLHAMTTRSWIEALARSSRPCAAIAKDVLDGGTTPYR